MKLESLNTFLAAGLVTLLAASVTQAEIIVPVGVTASDRFFDDARDDPANLLGPGLTVNDPIETSTHGNSNWGAAPNAGWFAHTGVQTLDFDLGGTFTLTDAHIWNWNGSTDITHWGVQDITLHFSQDAVFGNADDSTQSFTLSAATGLVSYTGEHFTLDPVSGVSHVRLSTDTVLATNNGILGLSEVRFSGDDGPEAPFVITAIEYAPDADTVTLTWRKTGAASYTAYLSSDLSDWEEDLDDSITADKDERPEDSEHMTVTFPLEGDRADAPELFFRIGDG